MDVPESLWGSQPGDATHDILCLSKAEGQHTPSPEGAWLGPTSVCACVNLWGVCQSSEHHSGTYI